MTEYKAYHINTTTLVKTDISRYIVDQSPVPDYARNDDFSIVFGNVSGLMVEEALDFDAACLTAGEYICFEKDGEIIWYGTLLKPDYVEKTKSYRWEATHIVNGLKTVAVADVTDYDEIDAGFVTDYDASAWGQGTLKICDLKGALKKIGETVNTDLITTVEWDFSSSDLTYFESLMYYWKQIREYALVTNAKAYDFLNQACRACGIIIKFRDDTIIFKKYISTSTTAGYKTATYNAYADLALNKEPDYNTREKLKNKSITVVNEGYYDEILAYEADQNSIYTAAGFKGYFQNSVIAMTGYSNSDGWKDAMVVQAAADHGLEATAHRKMKLKHNTDYGYTNNFANKLDTLYEYGGNNQSNTFYNNADDSVRIKASPEKIPRIEITRDRIDTIDYRDVWHSSDIIATFDNSGGYARCVFSTNPSYPMPTDWGLNYSCTIKILSGAYAGTYYGDTAETNHFTIINATTIKLSAAYSTSGAVTAEITWRPFIKQCETSGGRALMTFYEATPWMTTAEAFDVTAVNCDRDNNTLAVNTYDGVYPQGSTLGTWDTDDNTTLKLYPTYSGWDLSLLKLQTIYDMIEPDDETDNIVQVKFPKHFIFFTSLSTTDPNIFKMGGAYPIGTVGNWLFHLLKATPESYDIKDEEINIDDTETVADVCHKEVKYKTSLKERSIDIKQQELL